MPGSRGGRGSFGYRPTRGVAEEHSRGHREPHAGRLATTATWFGLKNDVCYAAEAIMSKRTGWVGLLR